MAEMPAPLPPLPRPCIVTDLCIETTRKIIRSRLYWHPTTSPDTESDLTVCADAVKSAFTPALPELLPDRHSFIRVEAYAYVGVDNYFFANSVAAPGPGLIGVPGNDGDDDAEGAGEDILPDDTALVIQKKTGIQGKSNQGRLFIGGIAETVQIRGVVTPGFVTKVKTLASKVNTSINVSGSGFTTTLEARHWARKAGILRPITKVYVVKTMGTRMDRRKATGWERL